VPAPPMERARSRWPLLAGGAGVVVAVGLVVAIFANSSPVPASSATAQAAPPVAAPAAPVVTPPGANDFVVSTPVALAVEPIEAEVFRDGKSLGTSPVVVDVPENTTVELELRRMGYTSQKLVLDGKKPKLMVRLEREKAAAVAAPFHARPAPAQVKGQVDAPTAKPKPKGSLGGGEIVNPWAH
ncbi:MAG TPA: hypothetical protein VF395_13720, partial [Polyangiaceae bacterium]